MDESSRGGVPGPPVTRHAIEAGGGVRFEVALVASDGDGIVRSLAEGRFPPEYRRLLDLLRALVGPGGRVLDSAPTSGRSPWRPPPRGTRSPPSRRRRATSPCSGPAPCGPGSADCT